MAAELSQIITAPMSHLSHHAKTPVKACLATSQNARMLLKRFNLREVVFHISVYEQVCLDEAIC